MSTAVRLQELLALGYDLLRRTEELGIKSEPHLPDRFTGSVETKQRPQSKDEIQSSPGIEPSTPSKHEASCPLETAPGLPSKKASTSPLGTEPKPQNKEEATSLLPIEAGTESKEEVADPLGNNPGPREKHDVPNPLVTEAGTQSKDQVPSHRDTKPGAQMSRPSGLAMLHSKIEAEIRFLMRVQGGQCKESHLRSSNLTQLRALLQAAEAMSGVTAVLKTFRYRDELEQPRVLLVDVVAEGGRAWVKAVGRKAESLLAAWAGRCPHGVHCVTEQARLFLLAAQRNPLHFRAPRCIFSFFGGVPGPVARRLQEMGVTVRGEILADATDDPLSGAIGGADERGGDSDSEEDCVGGGDVRASWGGGAEARRVTASLPTSPVWTQAHAAGGGGGCGGVNLDVTTMLTLVSALSHGGSHFAFKEQVLNEQAAEERSEPVLPALLDFLRGKRLVACASAARDFDSIVGMLGGPRERARARALLGGERVSVVPDAPSARALALAGSGRVTPRSVTVFGTGDGLRAVTATANARLVRAAAQQGVAFVVFLHRPRALTEGKECDAARLPSWRRRRRSDGAAREDADDDDDDEPEEQPWREFVAGEVGQQE